MLTEILLTTGAVTVSPVLIVGFALAFMQLHSRWKYYSAGSNIPRAAEKPLIGSFQMADRNEAIYRLFKQHGPVFYATMFSIPIISVADPDIIHHVLLKENFPKNIGISKSAIKFLGRNMVLLDHADPHSNWKRERRLAEPAFKISALRALNRTFANHAINFTQNLINNQAKKSESFDLTELFPGLTMEILSTSGFSYPLKLLGENTGGKFMESVQAILKGLFTPLGFIPLGADYLRWSYRKDFNRVDETFYKVIDDRIKALEEKEKRRNEKRQNNQNKSEEELEEEESDNENEKPHDLLDMLLMPDENGNRMDREELRNELLLFYIAGHETTATTLMWFMYSMCLYPEVAQKVRDEVDAVLGLSDGKNLVAPTSEQVDQLVYTKMALNETLRVFPPATAITRMIPETFEMKGYIFPKGLNLSCSVYNTHHNPDVWPNPEKFDPERFSKENSVGRHLFAFVPFSAGPRICLGRRFFYDEALIIISTIFRELTFEMDTSKVNGQVDLLEPIYKPAHVWVTAHRRLHPSAPLSSN